MHALEEKYIYVGTGSACSSHKKGESRVLRAMGVPPQVAQGTLRFSFCCMNTVEQAEIGSGCGRGKCGAHQEVCKEIKWNSDWYWSNMERSI